jgi:hypothetical protein
MVTKPAPNPNQIKSNQISKTNKAFRKYVYMVTRHDYRAGMEIVER